MSASLTLNSLWFRTLEQKRALVHVCRSWHQVGLPFLYEDICITHVSQMLQLLRAVDSPRTNYNQLIKTITFYCVVPVSFAERFELRLKRLFHLCPNIRSFGYLSPCLLPRPISLSTLPSITHLRLVKEVSAAIYWNILDLTAQNLVSLSFQPPTDANSSSSAAKEIHFHFLRLKELSCQYENAALATVNNWEMPCLEKLTCISVHRLESPSAEMTSFCLKYGAGLRYLHMHPGGYLNAFRTLITVHMQSLLDMCPALEHFVVHSRAAYPLTHQHLKWIDIWTPHEYSTTVKHWRSLRESMTTAAFPSLQGVRDLAASTSFCTDLPIILLPGQVSTPSDSFAYRFQDFEMRHDVGTIYRAPWVEMVVAREDRSVTGDESSTNEENDLEYQSSDADSGSAFPTPTTSEWEGESDETGSLEWDIHSEADHSISWEADMDALE